MANFLNPDDWPEAVVVLTEDPDTVAGYAPKIEARDAPEPHEVTWREAHHGRVFPVHEVHEQSAGVFDFSSSGTRYRLLPITLELYEKYVRLRTMGRPAFSSLTELLDTMHREW